MIAPLTALFLCHAAGDYILETKPKEISEAQRLNYEQVRPASWLQNGFCRGVCSRVLKTGLYRDVYAFYRPDFFRFRQRNRSNEGIIHDGGVTHRLHKMHLSRSREQQGSRVSDSVVSLGGGCLEMHGWVRLPAISEGPCVAGRERDFARELRILRCFPSSEHQHLCQ